MSVMDVVRTVNEANLILPAGDVKIGPYDYNLYANSQINDMKDINQVPLKTVGNASGAGGRRGQGARTPRKFNTTWCGWTASRRSICRCSSKAATPTPSPWSTASRTPCRTCSTCPSNWSPRSCSTSPCSCASAIENLIHEGAIGLMLTGLMILIFLGSMRATVGGFPFHSAFGAGGLHRAGPGRQHDQRHGAGRAGPGLFAA